LTRVRQTHAMVTVGLQRSEMDAKPATDCAKALIVDDHAVFREGLRVLMEARGFAHTVLDACDAPSALEVARTHDDLDLVMLDLYMPGMENLALLRELRASWPDRKIVLLTASEKHHDLRAAMAAGATGYIPKAYGIAQILDILRGILAGEDFFPADELAADDLPPRLREVSLSPRQTEVLTLIAQGYSNKEIARTLNAALPTVKNHVANIFEKLGTSNRVAAVNIGRKIGLIPEE